MEKYTYIACGSLNLICWELYGLPFGGRQTCVCIAHDGGIGGMMPPCVVVLMGLKIGGEAVVCGI